jgi:predicted porin
MNQHVAWSDSSGVGLAPGTDFDGIDTFNNSEIHFTPSITLDNGLTFGVNIQLEGNTNGGAFIDETYMTISGDSFGRLVIGNENSAGYLSMVSAPQVTSMYINSPSISGFLPITAAGVGSGTGAGFVFRDAKYSAYTEVAGNNDVNRISYYTPNFNGLVLGVSYAATGSVNAGNNFSVNRNGVGTVSDIFDIGVNYSGTVGGVDLNVGARWGTGQVNGTTNPGVSDPETWGIGATVGFGGFTVGGSYAENDNGGNLGAGILGVGSGVDSEGWTLGMTYDAPGPWSFEALTSQGESDSVFVLGASDDYEAYQIGAARDLGPGVSWNIYAVWLEGDQAGTIGTDLEGTVIGTAINLSF